jgi:signal transduction histidine kinase
MLVMAQVSPPADPRDADRYLRLSQFLELHSRWMRTTDAAESAHRIAQTVGLMLGTDDVEVVLLAGASGALRTGALLEPSTRPGARESDMATRAVATMMPQLHGHEARAVGVFPFTAAAGVRGYLRVAVPRPLFEGTEVAFLRFVASLAGALITATSSAAHASEVSEPTRHKDNESEARRYVAMAVHDLRNPLNVISGYGGLLADGSLGPLNPEQREAVDAINRQLGSLLDLIDRLIDFDRLAREETVLSASTFDVRELFDELRQRCFAGNADPVSWPEAEAGFEFTTDRRRLYAVVQNLVDNAIKHGGGEPITVECSRKDGRLVVTVTDRGPGLPAGLEAAFSDPHACERLREQGTGIGLYTVVWYVKMLSGRLEVRSPQSGGTEFVVSLPPLGAHAADAAA